MEKDTQFEMFDPADYNEKFLPFEQEADMLVREVGGDFTALRLQKCKPEIYELVRVCRATGWSVRRTMDLCKVGFHTVREIDRREADFISKTKAEMSKSCHGAARNLLDMIEDAMPKLIEKDKLGIDDVRALTDSISKLVNVGNLLSGEATEIHEHRAKATYTDWRKWEGSKADAIDTE